MTADKDSNPVSNNSGSRETTEEQIAIKYIETHGGWTTQERLASDLGLTQDAVEDLLKGLNRTGRVVLISMSRDELVFSLKHTSAQEALASLSDEREREWRRMTEGNQ